MASHIGCGCRYMQPLRDSSDFISNACQYDAVLLPTFPEHHSHLLAELLQQNCRQQTVIVTVHNPSQLENPGVLLSS